MITTVTTANEHIQDVTAALRRLDPASEQENPASWRFRVFGRASAQCLLRLEDDWLIFEAPLPNDSKISVTDTRQLWRLLRRNGRLRGGIKFALAQGKLLPQLRAEIPMKCASALERWIPFVHEGFKQLCRVARSNNRKPVGLSGKHSPKNPSTGVVGSELGELCAKTGWKLAKRRSGDIFVELDVPGEFYQAKVWKASDNVVSVAVPLVTMQSLSQQSRRSMSLLLLSACRDVRMARAVIEEYSQNLSEIRFEAMLPSQAAASELNEVFSALSVACRLCGTEVRLLKHESVADTYLTIWERSLRSRSLKNE